MKKKFSFLMVGLFFMTGFVFLQAQEQLPSAFSQKVVIEEYTGSWCGYCPDGTSRIRKLAEKYPGKVFAAAYHDGDEMEAPGALELAAHLGGLKSVPTAAVNRMLYDETKLVNRGTWAYLTDLILSGKVDPILSSNNLGTIATAGIRLDTKVIGSTAQIDAYFGFLSASKTPLAITVLILEDGITGYPQSNFMNTTAGSEWKGKGEKIADFVHDHVVRKFVSSVIGDPLTVEDIVLGTVRSRKWSLTLDPKWKIEKLHVLVFIHAFGTGKASQTILNAQSVLLGQKQGWD